MPNNKKGKRGSAQPKSNPPASKDRETMTLHELDALLDEMKVKHQGQSETNSDTVLPSTALDHEKASAVRPSSNGLHILLPGHLLDSLHMSYPQFKTLLYSDNALRVRCSIRNVNVPFTQFVMANYLTKVKSGGIFNRNILHYAVMTGDLHLVYEYIYLGMDPGYTDACGESVMSYAVRLLSEKSGCKAKGSIDQTRQDPTYLRRLTQIIKLFVSQHADVNEKFKGDPLLRIACRSNSEYNWEIITILLQHGASINLPFSTYFPGNKDDQTKLSSLAQSVASKTGSERPARFCPCWSGKVVSDCHGVPNARLPYPEHYICFCGTEKSYKACCKKRWLLFESWDPSLKRIVVYSKSKMTIDAPPEFEAVTRRIQTLDFGDEEVEEIPDANSPIPFKGLTRERMDTFRDKMIELRLVDPAYAFAMKITRFPLPVSRRTAARTLRSTMQTTWNTLIDHYIALGVDQRSRFEIEREAKIGQWGGAYIRECEFSECDKVEFRDVEKMYQCTKCQTTVYCSSECQRKDWTRHKTNECCEDWQAPRGLPSQDNITDYFNEHIEGMHEMNSELRRRRVSRSKRRNIGEDTA